MPKEFSRTERVGQQIQKEIAVILQREVKDPRLGMVTVSSVSVTRDLAHAKIHVSFFEDDAEKIKESIEILNDAAGYVRSLVASRVRVRIMPQLHFFYDNSLVEGVRMSRLVDDAIASDEARQTDQDNKEK